MSFKNDSYSYDSYLIFRRRRNRRKKIYLCTWYKNNVNLKVNCVFLSFTRWSRRQVLLKYRLYKHNFYQFFKLYSYCYRIQHVLAPTDTVRTVNIYFWILAWRFCLYLCGVDSRVCRIMPGITIICNIRQFNWAQKCSYKKEFLKSSVIKK